MLCLKTDYEKIEQAEKRDIMKLSQSFFYTLRENAKDEDSISSNLLVRAGMIKKNSNGIDRKSVV